MSIFSPHLTITEALAILAEEGHHKSEDHPGNVKTLEPKDIRRLVPVFQPRSLDGRLVEDEAHIRVLQDAIGNPEKPNSLDPLLVWWSGQQWYVIDGFHRLQAYFRAEVRMRVPVSVFAGTLEEAMAAAAAANSKDKLPMTSRDKMNMAWRLVRFTEKLSKAAIASDCAIASRSVANMRKVKAQLIEQGSSLEHMPDDWDKARREANGHEALDDFDPDSYLRERAEKMAKALSKTLGKTMHDQPEAFAMALMLADDRLPRRLMESEVWRDLFWQLAADLEAEEDYGAPITANDDPDADY